jgi:hypothetical protein
MADIADLSVTANSNTGLAPSNLPLADFDNKLRDVAALLARWYKDTNGSLVSTGSGSAYVVSTNNTYTANATGMDVTFRAHVACSPQPTLQVGSAPARRMLRHDGENLIEGEIASGQIVRAVYRATDDRWICVGIQSETQTLAAATFAGLPAAGTAGLLRHVEAGGAGDPSAYFPVAIDDGSSWLALLARPPAGTGNDTWHENRSGALRRRTDTVSGERLQFAGASAWITIDDTVESYNGPANRPTTLERGWVAYDYAENKLLVADSTSVWREIITNPVGRVSNQLISATKSDLTGGTYPAATHIRCLMICSNGGSSSNPTLVFSDGTNWRRVEDNTIIT